MLSAASAQRCQKEKGTLEEIIKEAGEEEKGLHQYYADR